MVTTTQKRGGKIFAFCRSNQSLPYLTVIIFLVNVQKHQFALSTCSLKECAYLDATKLHLANKCIAGYKAA